MGDVDEHAAAAAGAAALVGVTPTRESRNEDFLAKAKVLDVREVMLVEGQGGFGGGGGRAALSLIWHGIDPIVSVRVLHGSPDVGRERG